MFNGKKKTSLFYAVFSALLIVVSSCSISKDKSLRDNQNSLIGSWKMESFHWISKDTTYSRVNVHPGIFLFTGRSYSIQWTPTKAARVPFKILSKPTDEEKIEGFQSVVFNAGSYSYTDTTVISTAYIAKVPGFEGGKQFYSYNIKGDVLILTMYDETYPDGTKPEWSGNWKTKFVLKRVN